MALGLACIASLLAFGLAGWLNSWVQTQPSDNQEVNRIGSLIQQGARTFLRREYSILGWFALGATILIILFLPRPFWLGGIGANLQLAAAYVTGAVFSGLAGYIGMTVATNSNTRTAQAAAKGMGSAFLTGFRGGAVMGMAVVGASLLGVTAVIFFFRDPSITLGFSLGASSLALFAKAGGGIFTKTADIAADLVGKVELGIPEDDPRNPAVIADNVGDNVGDVAGMGADLFDSHVASLSAALVLAAALDGGLGKNVDMVFVYGAVGLISSIIGVIAARLNQGGNPTSALNSSTYTTTGLYVVLSAIATAFFGFNWLYWSAAMVGLIVGTIIGITSDYFTNDAKSPVQQVARLSGQGPAFTIISGISYGLASVFPALVGIGVAALLSFVITNGIVPGTITDALFGISMAAVGMLSIVGMVISNDAYGPIVDNARGLVEMANLGDKALEVTDELDSAGNTVKAITKGFAIGAAGLTVIALLGAFLEEANAVLAEHALPLVEGFDVMNPAVFFGLLVGAAVPAVFSAMLMLGVNRNADRLVDEVHRQFREIKGLREGKAEPQYDRCITIATEGALKELIPAGLMAIIVTFVVGFIGGIPAVGGFLAGNIISGLLLALFMSNAGGMWDNAKKLVEAGNFGGKGSDAHKAAVIGDTVGDPCKDTAGPSINTQITVVSLVASLAVGLFALFSLF